MLASSELLVGCGKKPFPFSQPVFQNLLTYLLFPFSNLFLAQPLLAARL